MWLNKVLQLLLILFTLICFSSTFVYKFRKRIEKISNSTYKYKTKYFEVPVDHFNYVNKDVFKIRYLINDDHWVPESGAPIFFYTGNEGDIEWFAENTGFVWETAPEFKALIVFAEHRYYGKSLPYGNQSYSDIRHWGYLTADQAMADFVDLITYLRSHQSDRPHSKRSPVIAFGGSYGGMLAAWIRMKYPAAVAGSLAASAPIWQFTGMTPCETFMRVTTSSYEITGKHCPSNIRATWKELTKLIQTEDGRKWLSTNWTLCKPLKNETDGYALKDLLNEEIINVAMANYPYPANFLGSLPGHPVKKFCQHLSAANLKGKELLGAVYNGLKVWFNHTGQAKCLNWDVSGPATLDIDGWAHQSCAEMVIPICSNGVNDMFEPDPWNLNKVVENCKMAYNITTRPYFVSKQYGGKHLEAASNIIFSNGLLDPWSSGGVLKNVSRSCVAVLIPEGAHHLDLRSSNKLDPASVTKARKYYKVLFKDWIKNFREHSF